MGRKALRSAASVVQILLVAATTSGCLTYKWKVTEADLKVEAPIKEAAKDQVPAFAEIKHFGKNANHFFVTNKSQEVIFVSYASSVAEVLTSVRVISGETMGMHKDRDSPDTPIAPGSSAEVSFYSDDKLTSALMVDPGEATYTLRIALKGPGGKLDYAIMNCSGSGKKVDEGPMVRTHAGAADQLACYLTGIIYGGWCWFVSPGDKDTDIAKKAAKEKYGDKAGIEYAGRE